MAVACKVILAACLLGACAPLGLGESSSCADGACQGVSETPSLLQSKHVLDKTDQGGKPGSKPTKGDRDDHAEKACRDLDWKSSRGITCSAYAHWNYCTMSGGYGTGWSEGWGSFGDSATKGVSADEACCACGGGKQAACTTTDGSGPSSGYPCKCGSTSCTTEYGICSADSSTCMQGPTPAPTSEACFDVGQKVMIKPSSRLFGMTGGSCATVTKKMCQGGGYQSYTFGNGASDCCLYYNDLQMCQACALHGANIAHGLTASSPDGDADQAVDGDVDTLWRPQSDRPGPHILQLESPPVFGGYGFVLYGFVADAPNDWVLLCDGIQIHSEANYEYTEASYSTCLGTQHSCSELQLSISSWSGTEPAIREFELYAGFDPAGCGGYYEAELATTDIDSGVASEVAGYSGSGYVYHWYWIDWLVKPCASGFYELKFTYATPLWDRQFKLVINSNTEVASLSFPTTGSWSTWGDVVHNVALLPGSNTIRLEVLTNCAVHVDRLTVTPQESV